MTTYRAFSTIVASDGQFVINELRPRNIAPARRSDGATTKHGAWARATAQDQPIRVNLWDGSTLEFANRFDPRRFERALYGGYVAYQYSMADLRYAPVTFEYWVRWLRNSVRGDASETAITQDNDAPLDVIRSLPTYRRMLRARSLEQSLDECE